MRRRRCRRRRRLFRVDDAKDSLDASPRHFQFGVFKNRLRRRRVVVALTDHVRSRVAFRVVIVMVVVVVVIVVVFVAVG